MWPTQALRRTTTNATSQGLFVISAPLSSSAFPAPRPCSPRLLLSRPPAMHPTRAAARAHTCCDGRPPPHVDAVPLCCPPPTCDTEPFARLLHTRDAVPNGRSTRLRCSLGAVARRSVARHCGFVHPVCFGHQLGPRCELVGIRGVELETPYRRNHRALGAMQRWRHFQTIALAPAFRELRANNIYASVLKLACCQSCAHGHLSQHHPSYLFFHTQNKRTAAPRRRRRSRWSCTSGSTLRAPPSRRARWPSSRSTAVSTGAATMASASLSAPRCPRRSAGRRCACGFVRARSPSIGADGPLVRRGRRRPQA